MYSRHIDFESSTTDMVTMTVSKATEPTTTRAVDTAATRRLLARSALDDLRSLPFPPKFDVSRFADGFLTSYYKCIRVVSGEARCLVNGQNATCAKSSDPKNRLSQITKFSYSCNCFSLSIG